MNNRMILFRQFITKTSIKIIAFVVVLLILAAVSQSIAPVITNEIAMGQLENSDEAFVMWETYNRLKTLITIVMYAIMVIFFSTIGRDTYAFIKTVKSDNT